MTWTDVLLTCPQCGKAKLREWHDLGLRQQRDGSVVLVAEFRCHCYACGFQWTANRMEQRVPTGERVDP